MGLNDRTYWWIGCDRDGCNNTTHDDSDQPEVAEQVARNCGYAQTKEGLWFCPEHSES